MENRADHLITKLPCSVTMSEQQAGATCSLKDVEVSPEDRNRYGFEAIFDIN